MSNKLFTKEEVKILSKNKYVKNVSNKAITYTDEFKSIFIAEYEKGKFPREIFEEFGFEIGKKVNVECVAGKLSISLEDATT